MSLLLWRLRAPLLSLCLLCVCVCVSSRFVYCVYICINVCYGLNICVVCLFVVLFLKKNVVCFVVSVMCACRCFNMILFWFVLCMCLLCVVCFTCEALSFFIGVILILSLRLYVIVCCCVVISNGLCFAKSCVEMFFLCVLCFKTLLSRFDCICGCRFLVCALRWVCVFPV